MKMQNGRTKNIIITIVIAAVLLCVILLAVLPTVPRAHGAYRLTVFFTGDLHGQVDNLPYYYTIIQQARHDGENVLLLDCGDLSYGGPRQEKGGVPEAWMLAGMKYDAMVLGNNEFKCTENTAQACDKQIKRLSENTGCPLLCANIKKDGQYLDGVQPYIIKNVNGLRIAVVGLTTDEIDNKETRNKTKENPVAVLENIQQQISGNADITVVLSHCEEEQNRNMRDVSAVIAGHIHEPTYTPQQGYNGIPIVRAGGKDRGHLGKLVLELKETENGWETEKYDFTLCSIEGVIPNKKIMKIYAGLPKN